MNTIAMVFMTVTQTLGLPQGLLNSICYVESKHTVQVIHKNDGKTDSIGICQIKYETATGLGYRGTVDHLYDPNANIYWAGVYLLKQLKRYNGNVEKAVAAYNAGTHRINAMGLTKNRKYVDKVFKVWVAVK